MQQVINGEDITSPNFQEVKQNLFVANGILFVDIDHHALAVIPMMDRHEFVVNSHLDRTMPHLGANKLIEKIKQIAYVVGLTGVVKKVLKLCGRCIQSKTLPHKSETYPVQDMPIPETIGERWHIDMWGPFEDKGKKYSVFGAIDVLTKFLVARAYTNKTANTATTFIQDEIVYKYGVPSIITSDKGCEFNDNLGNALNKQLGIRRIRTSRYSPRSNGEIERRWRSLKAFIRRNTDDFRDFQFLFPKFIFQMNNSPNSTTNCTPHYLMYAYTPNSAALYKTFDTKPTSHSFTKDREKERLLILRKVIKRMGKAAHYRKHQFDLLATKHPLEVQDQVLIKVQVKPKGLNNKITPEFRPDRNGNGYIVLEPKGACVKLLDTSRNFTFHEHMDNVRHLPNGKVYPAPIIIPEPPDPNQIFHPYVPGEDNGAKIANKSPSPIPIRKSSRKRAPPERLGVKPTNKRHPYRDTESDESYSSSSYGEDISYPEVDRGTGWHTPPNPRYSPPHNGDYNNNGGGDNGGGGNDNGNGNGQPQPGPLSGPVPGPAHRTREFLPRKSKDPGALQRHTSQDGTYVTDGGARRRVTDVLRRVGQAVLPQRKKKTSGKETPTDEPTIYTPSPATLKRLMSRARKEGYKRGKQKE